MICPICETEFKAFEGMRSGSRGVDGKSSHWCKQCQDEFDSIDHDAVAEKRLGM